jgi:hypothetical protein
LKTTRYLALGAVLAVFGAASVSAGEWCGRGGGYAKDWSDYVGDFTKKHGVKFSHGYFYVGKEQKHFVRKFYDWHFETYMYVDPHAHCPYYWCEGHGVWYPARYIHKIGPDVKGPPPAGLIPGGPKDGGPDGGPGGPPKPEGPGGPKPEGLGGPKGPGPDGGAKTPDGPPAKAGPDGGQKAPSGGPGGDGPPPEPTGSEPNRVARVPSPTTPPARKIPPGTFPDDEIPER